LTISAVAQDSFPDIPANHWVYEAIAGMKEDGFAIPSDFSLFRGNRPASCQAIADVISTLATSYDDQLTATAYKGHLIRSSAAYPRFKKWLPVLGKLIKKFKPWFDSKKMLTYPKLQKILRHDRLILS
jgi:hypothetical protein